MSLRDNPINLLLISGLKYLGSGRNRDTYLLPSGRNVIKVPRNIDGIYDNRREAKIKNQTDPWENKDKVYAKCRMIPGTNLLVMEYIDSESYYRQWKGINPIWVDSIDCGQVGLDRKGRLKAYDFANK